MSALLADLLVERSAALGFDGFAAFPADLLVEASAPLRLDGVAALLADLLVEGAAALGLHRLAALAADLFVEGVPVLVAHSLSALAASLADAHRALLLACVLFRHRPASPPAMECLRLPARHIANSLTSRCCAPLAPLARPLARGDQVAHALPAELSDLLIELHPAVRLDRQAALAACAATEEFVEGVRAFLEKRRPDFSEARQS